MIQQHAVKAPSIERLDSDPVFLRAFKKKKGTILEFVYNSESLNRVILIGYYIVGRYTSI